MCIFVENDKQLNPFKYIESLKNKDCDAALMRIVPKINVEKIKEMIIDGSYSKAIKEEQQQKKTITKIRLILT